MSVRDGTGQGTRTPQRFDRAGLGASVLLAIGAVGASGLGAPLPIAGFLGGAAWLASTWTAWTAWRRWHGLANAQNQAASEVEARLAEVEEIAARREQNLVDARVLHQSAARRFEALFNGLPVACFTVNEELDVVEGNSRCESLFGIPVPTALFRPATATFFAGKDSAAAESALGAVFRGETVPPQEWRVGLEGQAESWVMWQAIPMRDDEGRILGVVNAVVDVTGRKSTEVALVESEIRFRAAIDSLQGGFILIDADGVIRMINPPAARMFDRDVDDRIDLPCKNFEVEVTNALGQYIASEDRPIQVALRTGEPQFGVLLGVSNSEDRYWLEVSASPLFRPGEEKPYAVVATYTDVTVRHQQEQMIQEQMIRLNEAHLQLELRQMEVEAANEQLERLATTDGLTSLLNHRTFQERLGRHINDARKYKVPLSLALMDIDHFKRFNDTHGHLEGDNVLRSVARVLTENTRDGDIVARYGGEEFVILLPATTGDEAVQMTDRLREQIMKLVVPGGQVTASFGVATLEDEHTNRDAFIHAADSALYKSKHDGRNRVTHAERLGRRQAG